MEVKFTDNELRQIGYYMAERLHQLEATRNLEKSRRELTTKEAMELTGYKTHEFFREFLKRNDITYCKKVGNVNYYRESDLLRTGTANNKSYKLHSPNP